MKDEFSRTLNAAKAGIDKMDEATNAPLWSTKPAVVTKRDAIEGRVLKMEEIEDDITNPGGAKTAKTEAQTLAATTAWQLCRPLKIFAKDTNNEVLAGEVDLSWTELRFGKAQTLIDNWQLVHDRADSNSVALIAGGYIDAALIPVLQTQINTFNTASPKPKTAQAEIKALNIDLKKEWEKLKVLMEEIRELLVQFAVSQATFYNATIEAFDEDNTGVRHQSIQIKYLDDITSVPLPNVATKVREDNLERKASKEGMVTFMLQECPQGNKTIDSILPGYVPKVTSNVVSEAKKLTKLVIRMVKV